jgi:hypothetical protein
MESIRGRLKSLKIRAADTIMDGGIERNKTWIQTGRLAVTIFCSVHGESVLACLGHYITDVAA